MDCEEDYIGKSDSDIYNQRIKEHFSDKESHVYQHINIEKHKMDFENIKILDRASTALKLQYKEMLYIRKLNPSINRQMDSELFSFVIKNAIKDIQKYLKKTRRKDKN